jgi:hypothetical protein
MDLIINTEIYTYLNFNMITCKLTEFVNYNYEVYTCFYHRKFDQDNVFKGMENHYTFKKPSSIPNSGLLTEFWLKAQLYNCTENKNIKKLVYLQNN